MNASRSYAPAVLRIGVALVYIWFGVSQITDAASWASWVPEYATSFGATTEQLVLFNGIFETVFGILLLLGIFTRISAGLLALHAIHILVTVGYSAIGVRDFGIAMGAISVFLQGPDRLCFDKGSRE